MITLLKLGETVQYVHDDAVRGTVVGFGTIDNSADPMADTGDRMTVVIVSLIDIVWIGTGSSVPLTHMNFSPDMLRRETVGRVLGAPVNTRIHRV